MSDSSGDGERGRGRRRDSEGSRGRGPREPHASRSDSGREGRAGQHQGRGVRPRGQDGARNADDSLRRRGRDAGASGRDGGYTGRDSRVRDGDGSGERNDGFRPGHGREGGASPRSFRPRSGEFQGGRRAGAGRDVEADRGDRNRDLRSGRDGGRGRPYRPGVDNGSRPQRDGGDRGKRSAPSERDGEKRGQRGTRPRGFANDGQTGSFGRGDRTRALRPHGEGEGERPYRRRTVGEHASGAGREAQRRGEQRSPRNGDQRLWTRDGRPARGDRSASTPEWNASTESQRPAELRSVRPRHDDPEIPAAVTGRELDGAARVELRTLAKDNAEEVARHLVMAAALIDEDPELAHRHALSAGRRAGRVAIVRETLAITAYATGDYALALRELRTYRRISGRDDQLPLMVDSERGVGRPEKALELGRSIDRSALSNEVQASLAIAMSGARLDLGQPELALGELEVPQLDPNMAYSWSPALFQAYGDVLEELGRVEEAQQWWDRADHAADVLDEAAAVDEFESVDIEEIEELELDDELESDVESDTSGDLSDYTPEDEVAELLGEAGERDDGDDGTVSKPE